MTKFLNRALAPEIHQLNPSEFPSVGRTAMPNGVELVALNQGLQPVCRMSVVWPVGLADVDSPAALRLLRLMLMEGTDTHPGGELTEIFEFNGAWVRVEVARHITSVTVYFLTKTAHDVLPPVAEMIAVPLLPQDAFMRIRSKDASACRMARRKVMNKAAELSNRLMFGMSHPLARVLTPELIESVNVNELIEMHHCLFLSVRPTVYLAGAIPQSLLDEVEITIGRIPFMEGGTPLLQRRIVVPERSDGASAIERDENSLQTAIKLSIPSIGRADSDYDSLRYTVFALGGYFGSRLMSNIREQKGYTYGISATLSSAPEGAFVTVSCQCDNRYARAVIEETEKEIALLSSEQMDAGELDIVKSTALSSLTAMLDSPFTIMDYHQMIDQFGLPQNAYSRQVETLVSLTPEKIAFCADRYLHDAPRLLAMAGNPSD